MAYPTTALSALLTDLEASLPEVDTVITDTTSANGASTGLTVVDTGRSEANDRFVDWFLYVSSAGGAAPEGQERRVTDWVVSTGTFTVEYAFTAQVDSGDSYELRKVHPRSRYVRAINYGLESATGLYEDLRFSEAYCSRSNILEYAINDLTAATCRHIYKIWVTTYDVLTDSTATAGAATTLTDTAQSWATSGADSPGAQSMYVTIYDGTGAGQVRTASSNTSTVLTVSAAWTTNPDSTSQYKVLRAERHKVPVRVVNAYIDWGNREVLLGWQPEEGQIIRVEWGREPVALSAATDTTSVPRHFALLKSQQFLWERLIGKGAYPQAQQSAEYYRAQAQVYALENPQVKPADTLFEYAPGKGWIPSDYPFSRD